MRAAAAPSATSLSSPPSWGVPKKARPVLIASKPNESIRTLTEEEAAYVDLWIILYFGLL